MIFVIVGTDNHDFFRLVKEMDDIARNRKVVIQRGNTLYLPRYAESFKFTSERELNNLYEKADIIVTHAGAGSIINSLKYGRRPIVVPRLKRFDEHINDHQVDFASRLFRKGLVIPVFNIENLEKTINEGYHSFKYNRSKRKLEIVKFLEEWFDEHFGG